MISSTSTDTTDVKKLGDFISLQRGTTYKSSLLGQPGAVLIGLASIEREGGFRNDKLETYGGECPPKISLKSGDLYVSLKDITQDGHLLGAVARIPDSIERGRLTQDTVKLVFEKELFPKNYIYWLLRTPQYRTYCRSRQTGTTNLGLSREDFLSLPVPALTETTNAIVIALESIEKKIENLRRQNETLEAIAQTLFKHWFVDFEFPNEGGKPYKSSGGAMVQSDLGEIPVNWRVHKLGNVVKKSNTGADAIQKAPIVEQNTGIRCLRVGDLTNNRLFEDWGYCEVTQKNFEQYRLRENDILVTRTSSLGLNILITHDLPAVFNNGLIRIKLHENVSHFLIYCFLQSRRFKEHIGKITYETSTRPNMQINYLQDFLILEVEKNIEKEFSALVSKTLSKIDSNKRQIQTLTRTRDVLLPQLMSGKLRITEQTQAPPPSL